jgi:hypothetical protein
VKIILNKFRILWAKPLPPPSISGILVDNKQIKTLLVNPVHLPEEVVIRNPCFSIYFSSLNPKKATELTEDPLPEHSKSNIELNTSIYLYSMYTACNKSTYNLKPRENLIVSPETSTANGEMC